MSNGTPNDLAGHIRFGTENPTLTDEPFWKFMICNPHLDAYDVRVHFAVQGSHLPLWCFARLGATNTYLPDGRLICIGGEHEEEDDPDFHIYNDVVVIKNPMIMKGHHVYGTPIPSNFPQPKKKKNTTVEFDILGTPNVADVTVYGYPANVFPPTAFHTATYVRINEQEFIYIIGGTGMNHYENAPVFRLCLSDFRIERVETIGDVPGGCTSLHSAELFTVDERPSIEIETSSETIQNCKAHQEYHHQFYRLNIETGVWTHSDL